MVNENTNSTGVFWGQRNDRSWLEVTGKDRLSWLHNLTTNAIKTLKPGEGNYAFVLNIQGRMLFDLNAMILEDSIAIDIDRRWLPVALKHFNKYIIMEDVAVADRTGDFVRYACVGEKTSEVAQKVGFSQAKVAPLLNIVQISTGSSSAASAFRSDFCGPFAVEFVVTKESSEGFERTLREAVSSQPHSTLTEETIEVNRIENGIPWPGFEITEEYLPAETRQLARAVSFQKGCYLGQEVVERMRSRQVVARQLVMLKMDGSETPPREAEILGADEKPVGKVTSSCHSIVHGAPIALGYVKTAAANVGNKLAVHWNGQSVVASVLDLPSAKTH